MSPLQVAGRTPTRQGWALSCPRVVPPADEADPPPCLEIQPYTSPPEPSEKPSDSPSELEEGSLAFFRARYEIPKSIGLRFPERDETIENPHEGHVAFYEAVMNAAPTQLAPNGWGILLGCWMLW